MKFLKHLLVFLLAISLSATFASCDFLSQTKGSDGSSDSESVASTESSLENEDSSEEQGSSDESEADSSTSAEPDPDDEGFITIYTAEDLVGVIDKLNNGEINSEAQLRLKANIDMEGVAFTPIYEFRGLFDGNGYIISNIALPLDGASIALTDGNWVGYTVTSIGFIASAYRATITGLTLENVTAQYDTDKEIFLGALVGYTEGLIVENCSVSSNFAMTITHKNVGARNISGVAGLVGYSLDAHVENTEIDTTIDYTANSYEAFVGSVLGVGNVRVEGCDIVLDIVFVGDRYGHTGSVIGMERTPDGVRLACMYDSSVVGAMYIRNSNGYAWGEVGQGYLYDPDTREILDVQQYNTINVEKNVE